MDLKEYGMNNNKCNKTNTLSKKENGINHGNNF